MYKQCLEAHSYPKQDIERLLSEVNFDLRQLALNKGKKVKRDYCLLLQHITQWYKILKRN